MVGVFFSDSPYRRSNRRIIPRNPLQINFFHHFHPKGVMVMAELTYFSIISCILINIWPPIFIKLDA